MRKVPRILTLDEIEWIMTTDTSNEGCAQILGCTPCAIANTRRLGTDKARWVAEYLGQNPSTPLRLRMSPTAAPRPQQQPAEPSFWQRVWNWLFGDWSHA